jgi:hypothetical protein
MMATLLLCHSFGKKQEKNEKKGDFTELEVSP